MASKLETLLAHDLRGALKPTTLTQYEQSWRDFTSFCSTLEAVVMPATLHTVKLYVVHLHDRGLKAGTIRSKLSAVSEKHKLSDLPDPTRSFTVSRLLDGYTLTDSAATIRRPIRFSLLVKVLEAVDGSPYIKALYKAIFALMYFACLRISEVALTVSLMHTLKLQDVRWRRDGAVDIVLHTYKHSGKGGATLRVTEEVNGGVCPVGLLRNYRNLRGKKGDCFFVDQLSRVVTRAQVVAQLQATLVKVGETPIDFNSHSFRIGRTTDLYVAGFSDEAIRRIGRWSSDAWRKYIKQGTILLPTSP